MTIASMLESGYTATLKNRIEFGREEGIDLGRIHGVQSSLMRYLEKRFGKPSDTIRQRIQGVQDA